MIMPWPLDKEKATGQTNNRTLEMIMTPYLDKGEGRQPPATGLPNTQHSPSCSPTSTLTDTPSVTTYIPKLLPTLAEASLSLSSMRKPGCDTKETSKGYCSSLPQAAGFQLCSKNRNLRTKVQQKNFKEDEDDLINRLHALLGDRWPLIAGRLPGRTDGEIKKYWNTSLRWKLMRMGMDPAKHSFPLHREQKEREQFADSSVDDDRVSDTATCSEDKVCTVPDLNLDLNLS